MRYYYDKAMPRFEGSKLGLSLSSFSCKKNRKTTKGSRQEENKNSCAGAARRDGKTGRRKWQVDVKKDSVRRKKLD